MFLRFIVPRNSHRVIPCLIRHGAKLDVFGQAGSMPLHIACGKGYVDCVKELLRQHQLTGVDCDTLVSFSNMTCLPGSIAVVT